MSEPLGPPRDAMLPEARVIWMEIDRSAPWLTATDRLMVEIASQLMSVFRTCGGFGNSGTLGRLESVLARLGMSPADRSRLNFSTPTGPTGPNEYDRLGPRNKFADNGPNGRKPTRKGS